VDLRYRTCNWDAPGEQTSEETLHFDERAVLRRGRNLAGVVEEKTERKEETNLGYLASILTDSAD
jgi:hypothetical protein